MRYIVCTAILATILFILPGCPMPPTGGEATYVQITDPATEVAAYAEEPSGATLGVLAQKKTQKATRSG